MIMHPLPAFLLVGAVFFVPAVADAAAEQETENGTNLDVEAIHESYRLLGASLAASALRTATDSPPQLKSEFQLTTSRFVARHSKSPSISLEPDSRAFEQVKAIGQLETQTTTMRQRLTQRMQQIESEIELTRQGKAPFWETNVINETGGTEAVHRLVRFKLPATLGLVAMWKISRLQAEHAMLAADQQQLSATTLALVKQRGFLDYLSAVVQQDIAVSEWVVLNDEASMLASQVRLERLRALQAKINIATQRLTDRLQSSVAAMPDTIQRIDSMIDDPSGEVIR